MSDEGREVAEDKLETRSGSKSERTSSAIFKREGFISRQWRAREASRMMSSELLFRQFNLEAA